MSGHLKAVVGVLAPLLLLAAGCGGGSNDDSATSPGAAESSTSSALDDGSWEGTSEFTTSEGWKYGVTVRVLTPDPDTRATCARAVPPGRTNVPFTLTITNESGRNAPLPALGIRYRSGPSDQGVPGLLQNSYEQCLQGLDGITTQEIAAGRRWSGSGTFVGAPDPASDVPTVVLSPMAAGCIGRCSQGDIVLAPGATRGAGPAAASAAPAPKGTLTACSDVPFDVYEFEDASKPSGYGGFEIDLLQAIADRAGYSLRVVPTEFDGIFTKLDDGTCQVVASVVTVTPERRVQMDFSSSHVIQDGHRDAFAVAKGDVATLALLDDGLSAVRADGTYDELVARYHVRPS